MLIPDFKHMAFILLPGHFPCSTDVLLALAELGADGLTHDALKRFVKKQIHGSETTSEAGYVITGAHDSAAKDVGDIEALC